MAIGNGSIIIFRHREAKSGYALGEARVCDACGAINQINAKLIENKEGLSLILDKGKVIFEYVAEYSPEINGDGECICEFCGKIQD